MTLFRIRKAWWSAVVTAAVSATASAQPPAATDPVALPVLTASPIPTTVKDAGAAGTIIPVQEIPTPQTEQPTAPVAAPAPAADNGARPTANQTGSTGQVQVASPTNQSIQASDTGDLLSKSTESTGVGVQKRNTIVADPRIRGYRSGQYYTSADGGLFVPARADLDTPISKYDPGSIRDVILIRGPYSALYGPAFAILDVATLDSPRARDGCGTEWHVRSFGGYQTNGRRNDALLSVSEAGPDWGFRGTYDFLQGNDYRAGDGSHIANSYLSNNINFALGFDLSPDASFELKGLKVLQSGLEFPGLYFDALSMDTEAYSARLTFKHFGPFDLATADTWYNSTAGSGYTSQVAKQTFDQRLLYTSFNNGQRQQDPNGGTGGLPVFNFTDQSTSRFASRSIGYRLTGLFGDEAGANLKVGNDLSVVGQGLTENIRLTQISGINLAGPDPTHPTNPPAGIPITTTPSQLDQNTGIPNSNIVNPGLFAQGTLPVGERLKMTAGGRVDGAFASSNPRLITGNIDLLGPSQSPTGPQTTIDPFSYSADQSNRALTRQYLLLSAFLSSEFKIDENVTASASVGHAERPPTLTELYASGPFIGTLQQGTSRLIGDPNISPEKLTQFDVGLKGDYGWFQAGVNGFYAFVHDYITYDANKTSTDGSLTQVVFTNTDLATLAGFEAYGQANLTGWLTGFGTVSYVQGIDQTHTDVRRPANVQSSRRNDPATRDFSADTEPLPQIPPLEGRIGFRLHPESDKPRWQLEFSARMVAGQNSVATSLGEQPTPGFTTFDVRGFWQASDRLLLTAGVENIGDRLYREHLDPIAGNNVNINMPFYRPGTNFYFTSQFSY
ncbi:MAG TPA: TonB-dependent receptor [Fimbriiglobus sp.]|jgi:outer membrane receptor protein involved in Fe transport